MNPVDRETLIGEVAWRGACTDRAQAEAAIEAALRFLRPLLSEAETRVIATGLPRALGVALAQAPTIVGQPAAPDALFQHLAERSRVTLGHAVEHGRVACTMIVESLDEARRALLARALPREWADLFTPLPPASLVDAPYGTVAGHGHTLATGRPGSRHPLAEAAPRPAQANSVVLADNPHAEGKLSSAGDTDRSAETRLEEAAASLAAAKDERRDR